MSFTNSKESFYNYLVSCSKAYYNTDTPLISDAQFDQLVEEYESKFNETYTFLGEAEHNKEKLPVVMPSLNKIKEENEINTFVSRLNVNTYIISEKIDGISLLIDYTDTNNIKLYTRGDGTYGTNVTHLLKYFIEAKVIPNDCTKTIVRGELVLPKTCTQFGENLRNIICGVVNAKNPNIDILKCAHFVAYDMPDSKYNPIKRFDILRKWGFKCAMHELASNVSKENLSRILKKYKEESLYNIDGIVVAKDVYVTLPEKCENPKHIVAYKEAGVELKTKIIEIQWQQSRYGTLHPRVQIEQVIIDGSKINFVSGFNAKFIVDNRLCAGCEVAIRKCGDVIPNIVKVLTRGKETDNFLPSGGEIEWEGVNIRYKTSQNTEEQEIQRLTYAFKVLEAKGISESTITKLYKAGFTNELKCWKATVHEVENINGFKAKSAQNVVTSLQQAQKNCNFHKLLLMSSCFAGFGERKLEAIATVMDIADYIINFNLSESKVSELLARVSIVTLSSAFIKGCKQFSSDPYFMELLRLFYKPAEYQAKDEEQKTSIVSKKTYNVKAVFTGVRPDKDLKRICEERGIDTGGSTVSKTTTCLVVDDINSTSTKAVTARKNNIPIYTLEQFRAYYTL